MENTWNDIVLDTSAFLQSETEVLRKLCNNLWTIEEVLNEVRDSHSKLHLDFAFLTSNVKTRQPKPESMDFVIAFAKKTGDFASLSRTDLMVLALAHELRGNDASVVAREIEDEEEEKANKPVRPVIDINRVAQPGKSWASALAKPEAEVNKKNEEEEEVKPVVTTEEDWPSLRPQTEPRAKPVLPPPLFPNRVIAAAAPAPVAPVEEEEEQVPTQQAPPPNNGNSRILSLNPGVTSREEEEDEEGEDDGQEWAKPGSISTGWGEAVRKVPELPSCPVGCATADFAVQNVLLQLKLGVVSLDGRRINTVKSWVLKCDGCLNIIPANQQRLFCPKCGHASLARLAYSIDANGVRRYHYARNRRIKNKGIRFSIPKNADLLLREDQLLGGKWAQRAAAKSSVESQWGRDVNDALGLGLKTPAKVQVAYGTQNPNAAKGRERRGAAKKKKG